MLYLCAFSSEVAILTTTAAKTGPECAWNRPWQTLHGRRLVALLPLSVTIIHSKVYCRLLSTHVDRQGVDILFTVFCVCVFFLFVRLRISLSRIKLAASNFAWWFIGVQGRESHILGNFAPQKPKISQWIGQRAHWTINRTGRSLAQLAGLGWLKSERRSIYSTLEMRRYKPHARDARGVWM